MSIDVIFSSVDLDEFDQYGRSLASQTTPSGSTFHEAIFNVVGDSVRFNRTVTFGKDGSEIRQRILKVSINNGLAPMGKVSGELGATITWGGADGAEVSGYASGSASDDNGNKAEVKVEVNGDGSGKATVSAKHEE